MSRPIPRTVLPHVDLVEIDPLTGVTSTGRTYGDTVTIHRALIADGTALIGNNYAREAEISGVVYCDRAAFDTIPAPDSRVRLWAGTADVRDGFVRRVERYQHPRIGDVLVVVVR